MPFIGSKNHAGSNEALELARSLANFSQFRNQHRVAFAGISTGTGLAARLTLRHSFIRLHAIYQFLLLRLWFDLTESKFISNFSQTHDYLKGRYE